MTDKTLDLEQLVEAAASLSALDKVRLGTASDGNSWTRDGARREKTASFSTWAVVGC